MKNDVGNVGSDADGMKNIWRKYMEKLPNVENDGLRGSWVWMSGSSAQLWRYIQWLTL